MKRRTIDPEFVPNKEYFDMSSALIENLKKRRMAEN